MDFKNPNISTFRRVKDMDHRNGVGSSIAVNFKFRLIPPPTDEYHNPSRLAALILEAGGRVCENGDDYTVTILDMMRLVLEKGLHDKLEVPNDAYSSCFVYHSIHNFKNDMPPPDLKRYLITPSIYEPYDPLQILLRNAKWSELDTLMEPVKYSASQIMAKLKQRPYSVNQAQISPSCQSSTSTNDNDITESNPGSSINRASCHLTQDDQQSVHSGTQGSDEDICVEDDDHNQSGNESSDSVSSVGVTIISKALDDDHNQTENESSDSSEGDNLSESEASDDDHNQSENENSDSSEGDNLSEASDDAPSCCEPEEERRSNSSKRGKSREKVVNRRPYSLKEDKLIITKLYNKKAFRYTGGNRLWVQMAKSNEASVMAHVVGSAGMNFMYYFHILGVACENRDRQLYKIIQMDFEFCLNKTGPLPPQVRSDPLGSIPKPCVDWAMHYRCYTNLAVDYDECLYDKSGRKKGTDALRFTHAYYKSVCGNTADTEAHLVHRYTKHDLIVDGVFQCLTHLQDRIVNCVKKDKISKTLCSKFFIVHACFGKYYNDDNCRDVQPIYYMDDLFRNMSKNLGCPSKDPNYYPPTPPSYDSHRPPDTGWSGWHSEEHISHVPPTKKGWTSGREEYSKKENPWPGEQGRPWSFERDREPYIRDDQRYQGSYRPPYNNRDREFVCSDRGRVIPSNGGRGMLYDERRNNERGRVNSNPSREMAFVERVSGERGRDKLSRDRLYTDRGPVVLSTGRDRLYVEGGSGEMGRGRDRLLIEGGSGERGRVNPGLGRYRLMVAGGSGERGRVNPNLGRDRLMIAGGSGERGRDSKYNRDRYADTHANRPFPDTQFSSRQSFLDVMDRDNTRGGKQSVSKMRNEFDTSRGQGGSGSMRPSTRDPSSYNQYDSRNSDRGVGGSSAERGRNQKFMYSSSTTPRGQGGNRVSVSLPPAGFAVTRGSSRDEMEDEYDIAENNPKYYIVQQTSLASNMSSKDLGLNFDT